MKPNFPFHPGHVVDLLDLVTFDVPGNIFQILSDLKFLKLTYQRLATYEHLKFNGFWDETIMVSQYN